MISISRMGRTEEGEIGMSLNASNVPPCEQFVIAANDYGGYENMTFTQRDFSNMRQDDSKAICQHDVILVVDRFENWKRINLAFFYAIPRVEVSMYYV